MKQILVTREFGFPGKQLTKEQFVEFLKADIESAKNEYYKLEGYNQAIRFQEIEKERFNNHLKKVTAEVEKKLKTEKGRKQRIEREMNAFVKNTPDFVFRNIDTFDFRITPLKSYYDCILKTTGDDLEERLGKCYDLVCHSCFNHSLGWRLVNNPNQRAEIELILPKELQERYNKLEKDLKNALTSFYN